MQDETVGNIMWLLAILTPILGLLTFSVGRSLERNAQASGALQTPGKLKLKSMILGLSGPVNLLFWITLNHWLDRIGYRSVIGYVLAAVVFLAMGFLTGFFSRWRERFNRK